MSLLLGALLFASALFPGVALGQEDEDTRTFTQSLVCDASVCHVGDSFTVDLVLTCDNFDEYPMYAYSTTLCIDTNILQIDEEAITVRDRADFYLSPCKGAHARDNWHDVVVNYKSTTLSGVTWGKDEVVLSIPFTAIAPGYAQVNIDRVNVSNKTGMKRRPCEVNNLQVSVLDDTLPVAAGDELFTAASGLIKATYCEEVPEGMVPYWANQPFCWDGQQYVTLLRASYLSEAQRIDFSLQEDRAVLVERGDANGNGVVNIVDVQIAYDVAQGVFVDFGNLSQKGWLACDADGNGTVDAVDAFRIQTSIFGLSS